MYTISVGFVEDNFHLAQDLRDKLALSQEIAVVLEANDGKELLKMLKGGSIPDVLLMDIVNPVMDGIEGTWQVKQMYPNLKIVMMTVMDDEQKLFQALQAGASGYLLKDAKPNQLLNAINEVLEGGLPLSPSLAAMVLKYLTGEKSGPVPQVAGMEGLTKHEKIVLELYIKGMNKKQIVEALFIANKTVGKHMEHIYKKLHLHSYEELIAKLNSERNI